MTVTAVQNSSSEEKDENRQYIYRERYSGSFSRTFDVSGVRTENIAAAFDNGVLTLTMPKKSAQVPTSRRLEIQ